MILAGILLKIGTYGFARFSIPMLPEATATCVPWLLGLSAAGIIYGALVALAQTDMKRLIAYSSVSHLGFCMLGLFALNGLGVEGGVLQMINHGLSTGGLFAVVGMIYERYHTREIRQLGGLARRTPVLAFFFVLFTLSSIGLPGLNGFAGEFLVLIGMFPRAWTDAADGCWRWPTRSWPWRPCSASCWGPGTCCTWCSACFLDRLQEPGPRPTGRCSARSCAARNRGAGAAWSCSCSGSACIRSFFWRRCGPRSSRSPQAPSACRSARPRRCANQQASLAERVATARGGADTCRMKLSTCCCRRSFWCWWPR